MPHQSTLDPHLPFTVHAWHPTAAPSLATVHAICARAPVSSAARYRTYLQEAAGRREQRSSCTWAAVRILSCLPRPAAHQDAGCPAMHSCMRAWVNNETPPCPAPLSQQRQALRNQGVRQAGQQQGHCTSGEGGAEGSWEGTCTGQPSAQPPPPYSRCTLSPCTWAFHLTRQAAGDPQLQQVQQVEARGQAACDGLGCHPALVPRPATAQRRSKTIVDCLSAQSSFDIKCKSTATPQHPDLPDLDRQRRRRRH